MRKNSLISCKTWAKSSNKKWKTIIINSLKKIRNKKRKRGAKQSMKMQNFSQWECSISKAKIWFHLNPRIEEYRVTRLKIIWMIISMELRNSIMIHLKSQGYFSISMYIRATIYAFLTSALQVQKLKRKIWMVN